MKKLLLASWVAVVLLNPGMALAQAGPGYNSQNTEISSKDHQKDITAKQKLQETLKTKFKAKKQELRQAFQGKVKKSPVSVKKEQKQEREQKMNQNKNRIFQRIQRKVHKGNTAVTPVILPSNEGAGGGAGGGGSVFGRPRYKEPEDVKMMTGLRIVRLQDEEDCNLVANAGNTYVVTTHYILSSTEDIMIDRLTIFNDLIGYFDKPEPATFIRSLEIFGLSFLFTPLNPFNGSVTFSELQWLIPKDTDVLLNIHATIANITKSPAALSRETFRLGVQDRENSLETLKAIDRTSGQAYTAGNGVTIINGNPEACPISAMSN